MRPEVVLLRRNVHDFLHRILAQALPGQRILEIGPMQQQWTPVKEYYVDVKSAFEAQGCEYRTCDSDTTAETDYMCDMLELPKFSAVVGRFHTVVACEVFEHVGDIWRVPQVVAQLLVDGGTLFFSVPYYFYHHQPFPDYWRMSEHAIHHLFNPYFEVEIEALTTDDIRKPIHFTVTAVKRS